MATLIPTLPASDYSDPNRYKIELDRIFYGEWIYALHESQLPNRGDYLTVTIGDKPLLLTRGPDDVIRGFYNVCAHRGHLLATGCGHATRFVCPYHAWNYDCHGVLRGARRIPDLQAVPEKNRSLTAIEVDSIDGFVFVRMQPGGPTLSDLFGEALRNVRNAVPDFDRLRFTKRVVAEVDGNWKIMVENYLECYHCAPTHPALVDLLRIKEFKIEVFPYHLFTRAPAGRTDNSAYQFDAGPDAIDEFFGWWLWPNVTFNVFPGKANLLIFHMLPVSAEKSIGVCDYFFIDGKVDDEAQALMDWEANVLEKEDNDLIVAAHKGMKSGALSSGVFVLDSSCHEITEEPLAHFNDLVTRAVEGKDALHPEYATVS